MPEDLKEQAQEAAQDLRREWRALRRTANVMRGYIARLLQVSEQRKPKIYDEVFRGAELDNLNYWLEIIFSIGIATLGLIINSPAVVIGAMLISPLMGPIIANGMAIALGDFYLGFKSLTNIIFSSLASILLAAVITWILPFRSPTPEILARVQPTLLDLGVAVLSGAAGGIVVCRGGMGGGVTALPGVAVAVALMPPLGVIGFGVGAGWDWTIIRGGGLLYLTNLVAIILSSFAVFFAVRMDTPAVRREINELLEAHEQEDDFYRAIEHTPLRRMVGRVGALHQRVLILVLFLALVSWPLGRTLGRLRDEANIRRIVLEEVDRRIPRERIFREDLEIFSENVNLRIVATLPEGFQRAQMQERMQERIGRPVSLVLIDVATQEEVVQLAGRLTGTTSAAPAVETLDELRAKLWARIRPALAGSWPAERAPLLSYKLLLEAESSAVVLQVVYLGTEDLTDLGRAAVEKALRERTGAVSLRVTFERVEPPAGLIFRGRSDSLTAEHRRSLDHLAAVLARYPQVRAEIDLPGTDGQELDDVTRRRSERVRQYLLAEKKISETRLLTVVAPANGDSVRFRFVPPGQP